jgi:hypothetical protein
MALRLVKAACPGCGAGLSVDPHAEVVTCQYCRLSSFVHRTDQPPPASKEGYGTIQVTPPNAAALFIGIAAMGVLVVGGAVTSILLEQHRREEAQDIPAPVPTGPARGTVCDRAVTCCRVVIGASGAKGDEVPRTCEALRALSDADCARQLETFKGTAKSMHRRCE